MQGQGRQANEMLLCGLCAFPATTLPRQGEGGQYRGRRTETLFCRMGGCLFFPKRQAVFCAKLHHPTDKQQVRGIYTIRINSYGEVYDAKVVRSCGIEYWDNQVLEIIRKMPRWTPTINYYGKGEYRESVWTIPIVFKRNGSLIAHTTEKHLEVGVPVCYLNEQGDTIVPYNKYKFCQTDTIRNIGFVYEYKQDARIVCINNQGKELFYMFKHDNGPDYIREGLFRIMDENGLIGFADSLGNVVIKPQFKFAFPFKNGKAKVTFTGEGKAIFNGEHHEWVSDKWQYINKKGELLQ